MKEMMKTVRLDMYISAIMSLIMGILFVVFPIGTESVLSIIIGVIILIVAITMLIGAIANGFGPSIPAIVLAILLGILGGWIIANPTKFAIIIPIVVGVMIAIHGIQSFMSAFTVKAMGVKTWWVMLIVGVISVAFGLVCIFCSFGVLQVSGILMGVMMIIDAIVTIIVTARGSKYKKEMSGDKEVQSKVIK